MKGMCILDLASTQLFGRLSMRKILQKASVGSEIIKTLGFGMIVGLRKFAPIVMHMLTNIGAQLTPSK